jgi:hypothetical protein
MAHTYQPAKSIALQLRKVLAETLSTTCRATNNSSAEQSDASSSRTSSTAFTYVSDASKFVDRSHCSPQDSGHHQKTVRACSIASSVGKSSLQAVSATSAEDQIIKGKASMCSDQQFPWAPSGTTCDNEVLPKDMSNRDNLHLALFYTPQLRDFAFF